MKWVKDGPPTISSLRLSFLRTPKPAGSKGPRQTDSPDTLCPAVFSPEFTDLTFCKLMHVPPEIKKQMLPFTGSGTQPTCGGAGVLGQGRHTQTPVTQLPETCSFFVLITSVLNRMGAVKVFLVTNKSYQDHLFTLPKLTQVTFLTSWFYWIFKYVLSWGSPVRFIISSWLPHQQQLLTL